MPEADENIKLGDWSIHDKHAKYFVSKKAAIQSDILSSLSVKDTQATLIPLSRLTRISEFRR